MKNQLTVFMFLLFFSTSCLWNYRENIKVEGAMKAYFLAYDEISAKKNLEKITNEMVLANASTDSTKIKACFAKVAPIRNEIIEEINYRVNKKTPAKFVQTGNFDKYKIEEVYLTTLTTPIDRGSLTPDLIVEVHFKLLKPLKKFDEIRMELVNIRNRPYGSLYAAPENDTRVFFKIGLHKDNKEFSFFNIQ